MDDEAPDFICAAMLSPPPVGVFRVSAEPEEESEEVGESGSNPFGKDEEE